MIALDKGAMMKKILKTFSAAMYAGLFIPNSVMAYDWSVTTAVGAIEASYMPDILAFNVKNAAGSCSAGQLLSWNIRGTTSDQTIANISSVYALLLTAIAGNRNIIIYGNNAGCTIDHIYIL